MIDCHWTAAGPLVEFDGSTKASPAEGDGFEMVCVHVFHEETVCYRSAQSFPPEGQIYYFKRAADSQGEEQDYGNTPGAAPWAVGDWWEAMHHISLR